MVKAIHPGQGHRWIAFSIYAVVTWRCPVSLICPPFCRRVHDESPGEVVVHESAPVHVPQLPDPCPQRPLLLQLAQAEYDTVPRLYLGSAELGVDEAERLLAALEPLVAALHDAQPAGALGRGMRCGVDAAGRPAS